MNRPICPAFGNGRAKTIFCTSVRAAPGDDDEPADAEDDQEDDRRRDEDRCTHARILGPFGRGGRGII